MSKYQWISVLGLWVMVFLFLGFPAAWDKGVAVFTGLIIVTIAYRGGSVARAEKTVVTPPPSSSTFVENKDII